jgi:thiamine biosynthesis protein ThiS
MRIEVNGEPRDVRAQKIGELLVELGLAGVLVAVEKNRAIVPRAAHESTPIAEGDTLEIVHFVGGG